MSPEVALLVRAALLGLLVFAIERFGRRRQERRAAAQRTIIRLPATHYPATPPVTGRPVQVDVVQAVAEPVIAEPGPRKVVNAGFRPIPTYGAEHLDGHVTEKRAA